MDYKIHCFNGSPEFIQVIRRKDVGNGEQIIMDPEWNALNWTFETYGKMSDIPERPVKLEEMMEDARILSKGIRYIRVDMYCDNENIYFGEMTFTPSGGFYPYKNSWTYEKDVELGRKIIKMEK